MHNYQFIFFGRLKAIEQWDFQKNVYKLGLIGYVISYVKS